MARILLLTPQLPYPPHQGTSLRNYCLLRALAVNHEVTLLSFAEGAPTADQLATLGELGYVLPPVLVPAWGRGRRLRLLLATATPDVAHRLRNAAFQAALTAALREQTFDAVQIEGIELAWAADVAKAVNPRVKIVLDCHNAETELQRRALQLDLRRPGRWPAAAYSAAQVGRLARFEAAALRSADAVIVVSEHDRGALVRVMGNMPRPMTVVPNMIDVNSYSHPEVIPDELRFDVVFTGKMDYRPNVDGVLWFAEAIWTFIRRERPDARWAVVGQRPHPRLEALRDVPGVTLTGRVERVQPYLAGAGVYAIPLRIGSGTRLKLIEAMSAGCAVVSTSLGAEGFDVVDGRELVLADAAETFAAAVLALLDDSGRRAQLAQQAQAFAAQFDWRWQVDKLNEVYASLMENGE